jgi:hypothetical protein
MNLFLYGLELSPVVSRAVVGTDRFWQLATPAVLLDHELTFVAPARPVVGGAPAAVEMPGRRIAGALVLATPHDLERLAQLYPIARKHSRLAPFELSQATVLTRTPRLKETQGLVFRASLLAEERCAPAPDTIDHLQAVALRLGHSDGWIESLGAHPCEFAAV